MRSIIKDSVVLPATAEALYKAYMDPKQHAAITGGGPVKISAKAGSKFSVWDGGISGTTLAAIPSRLVVQSWRSTNFNDGDPDSTLILSFVPEGKNGRIDLVHLDVPEVDYRGVTEGWKAFYWDPWREYLAKGARKGSRK